MWELYGTITSLSSCTTTKSTNENELKSDLDVSRNDVYVYSIVIKYLGYCALYQVSVRFLE